MAVTPGSTAFAAAFDESVSGEANCHVSRNESTPPAFVGQHYTSVTWELQGCTVVSLLLETPYAAHHRSGMAPGVVLTAAAVHSTTHHGSTSSSPPPPVMI
jgi:hypothetical protein